MASSKAARTRLLTSNTSKLTKLSLTTLLRRDDAWILLPAEVREHLYSMLPEPGPSSPFPGQQNSLPDQQDPDIHPLNTVYKPYIEEAIRRFAEDLREGREVKKWREEAMLAGRERDMGEFDDGVRLLREEYWGVSDERTEMGGNGDGDGKVKGEERAKRVDELKGLGVSDGEVDADGKGGGRK